MQDKFLNILRVYDKPEQRTIEYLKEIYVKKYDLYEYISRLAEKYLTEDVVKNKKILIKPNWVLHNRKETDEICLRTHDNIILVIVEYLLMKQPSKITIGDAPVQGARWNDIVRSEFVSEVKNLEAKYGIPVFIKDFRRVTFNPKNNNLQTELNPISNYIIFDLGKESYLEPISVDDKNIFRVTDYDPDRLADTHRPGVHKYCITKEIFDNDIIISLPKVKTHQKAGITNALKILVGINGDKDFLPHHRIGGTKQKGDCYPGYNLFINISEKLLDCANKRRGKKIYKIFKYASVIAYKLSFAKPTQNLAAAWYGNDTTWRMTMDLNKIARYGKPDGTISEIPQRDIFSISDGIVGGQGDGPLKPEPLALGVLCLSNNSELTDASMTVLMGFEPDKIPLIKAALLSEVKRDLIFDGEIIQLDDLKEYSVKTIPPPGWIEYFDN